MRAALLRYLVMRLHLVVIFEVQVYYYYYLFVINYYYYCYICANIGGK